MDSIVKKEIIDHPAAGTGAGAASVTPPAKGTTSSVIDLSSSGSDSDDDEREIGKPSGAAVDSVENGAVVKRHKPDFGVLPLGFLDPLPREGQPPLLLQASPDVQNAVSSPLEVLRVCRQFWKAGDFDGKPLVADPTPVSATGMDHVRVHPKFLHSNATSHKWALGALAELLDNSLDEVCKGASFVNIDMRHNNKDGNKVLLVEDNGGGMDPEKMRQCMSLGYSVKSKLANTIGQYGNGFKTSTMRLGADVIVFSRSKERGERSSTYSIGMLSYSFLRNTGKEDIVVPILDYEKRGKVWKRITQATPTDWDINLETILQWSPYSSEAELLQQFKSVTDQGTRVIIYNLWEDDQGKLELDFDSDKHDIQVRGVNRDENKIQMAEKFPNSRHFLTYRHSLRSYASILYLRLPYGFRMILRSKEIEHHNIVNDMMMKQEVTYRPQNTVDGPPKDPNMVAVVTMGFVKDAKHHIDVQGFNVYHKNRLIKPFWRVWNPPGSDGRGVIGVLEANFVEPAHDKQDFERTIVLSRLEARLIQLQKTYWTTNCHRIGYAPRINKKRIHSENKEGSPDPPFAMFSRKGSRDKVSKDDTAPLGSSEHATYKNGSRDKVTKDGTAPLGSSEHATYKNSSSKINSCKAVKSRTSPVSKTFDITDDGEKSDTESLQKEESDSETDVRPRKMRSLSGSGSPMPRITRRSTPKESPQTSLLSSPCLTNIANGEHGADEIAKRSQRKGEAAPSGRQTGDEDSGLFIKRLETENEELRERLKKMEESMSIELQQEKDKNKSLADELETRLRELEDAKKEQDVLIDIFSEERSRRDAEEESLRKKLKEKTAEIEKLRDRLG